MGLFSFLHGKTGKLVLARLYGWGAAAVILGALFKLMHWPGAGVMLTIGMSVECVIFFLSAFEPIPKEYDWSLVYPEFAEDGEIRNTAPRSVSNQSSGFVSTSQPATGNLNLDIDPSTSADLKSGLQKLTSSLNQMAGIGDIVDASTELSSNIRRASGSMTAVAESANILTDNYQRTAQTINTLNEQSKNGLEQMRAGYDNYRGQLSNLGQTLGAMNSSFELYLQETQKVQGDYSKLHTEIGALINNVQTSAAQTQQFGNQMEGLNNNIGQLNSIYGSMLTAVNSVVNK